MPSVGQNGTWVRVLGLSLLVSLLVGCSSEHDTDSLKSQLSSSGAVEAAPEEESGSFGGIDDVREEYRVTAAGHSLPEGVGYPEPPYQDESALYERGVGAGDAVTFWNCSWGRSYLAAFGSDEAAASAALDEFAAVEETETFRRSWDPDSLQKDFFAARDAAVLGDPSAMRQFIEPGCP